MGVCINICLPSSPTHHLPPCSLFLTSFTHPNLSYSLLYSGPVPIAHSAFYNIFFFFCPKPSKFLSTAFKHFLKFQLSKMYSFYYQGCPTCNPCAACSPGWLWTWPNTKSQIYLKPFFGSSAFVSVCVFNVWPKRTLLLPVWPRDTKRLDTPGRDR